MKHFVVLRASLDACTDVDIGPSQEPQALLSAANPRGFAAFPGFDAITP
ncbi:hypothetical protein [Streptomyces sp. NPDC057675]